MKDKKEVRRGLSMKDSRGRGKGNEKMMRCVEMTDKLQMCRIHRKALLVPWTCSGKFLMTFILPPLQVHMANRALWWVILMVHTIFRHV